MDPSAKRRREPRGRSVVRPGLLAGGLGLMWFVQVQESPLPIDAPGWGVALIVAGRLAADFVGALVVVSVVRLGLAVVRLAVARWRAQRQLER